MIVPDLIDFSATLMSLLLLVLYENQSLVAAV